MGIRKLLPELRSRCGKSIRPFDPVEFEGRIAAADAAGLMYVAISSRTPGDQTCFLRRFVEEWKSHLERGLLVIWVLDGDGPNPAKAKENQARRVTRDKTIAAATKKATDLLERAQVLQEQAKHTESAEAMFDLMMRSMDVQQEATRAADCPTARVSRSHYDELRRIFVAEGIPFVTAKTEGEKCCAWMARQGLVDLVMTDDSDALAYGAPLVYFNPWVNSASRPKQVFELEALLADLKLSQTQFVQLCSLLDNDFNKDGLRLDGVSFDVAHRLLRAHESVEKWVKSISYKLHCNKSSVRNSATWSHLPPFQEYTDDTSQFSECREPDSADPPRRCLKGLDERLSGAIRTLWELSDVRKEDLVSDDDTREPQDSSDTEEEISDLEDEVPVVLSAPIQIPRCQLLTSDPVDEDISTSSNCTPDPTPTCSPVIGQKSAKRKSPDGRQLSKHSPKRPALEQTVIGPRSNSPDNGARALSDLQSQFASFEVTWHLEPTGEEK
jgi:5'-3' exonuclease